MRIATFASFAALLTALTACPAPTPPSIAEGEGEGAEGEGEGAEGEGEGCIPVELGPVTFNFQDDVSTHYQAEVLSDLDGAAPDYLVLQFFNYNERIDALGVGTFPLDDAINDNYGHCAECLLVLGDQIDATATPLTTYFQSKGSITVDENPRNVLDLRGRITGLQLVESTIGGDALESEPVPGGACLDIGDVDLDVKFVPGFWTCAPEAYNDGTGVCDCNCGAPDADCFEDRTSTTGCAGEQICVLEFCEEPCNVLDGTACPGGVGACVFGDPADYCEDVDVVDPANLGEDCSDDFARFVCDMDGTIPRGLCDFDLDADGVRVCKPVCGSAADCAAGEACLSVVGGSGDGAGRGFCDQPLE